MGSWEGFADPGVAFSDQEVREWTLEAWTVEKLRSLFLWRLTMYRAMLLPVNTGPKKGQLRAMDNVLKQCGLRIAQIWDRNIEAWGPLDTGAQWASWYARQKKQDVKTINAAASTLVPTEWVEERYAVVTNERTRLATVALAALAGAPKAQRSPVAKTVHALGNEINGYDRLMTKFNDDSG